MLVTYRRSGGPKPRSDESVEVSEDGTVTSRRVVALARVGRFASQTEPAVLKSLAKAVEAVADATVEMEAPGRPPYEIEDIETSEASLSFHPEQKLPKPVTTLRNRLRKVYADLGENPVAGIELAVDASGTTATVRAIGGEPCEVDWANASATFDLHDARQALVSSGQLDFGLGNGRQQLATDWQQTARLSSLDFSPEMTLQVRLGFSMRFDGDRWRDCQVTVVAGKGW
jgi:hypothetical protein